MQQRDESIIADQVGPAAPVRPFGGPLEHHRPAAGAILPFPRGASVRGPQRGGEPLGDEPFPPAA